MDIVKFILIVQIATTLATINAEPFSYDAANGDVQEYVVDCLTNSMRNGCSIALMQHREDEVLRPEDHAMTWHMKMGLSLKEWRCVEMLKGDRPTGHYSVFYLYETPRVANELPLFVSEDRKGETNAFSYVVNGRWENGCGKSYWRFSPPYDPFDFGCNEYVELMLLTPEKTLDKNRIRAKGHIVGTNTISRMVRGDTETLSPEEITRRLGLESTFSNRVFRMNEGCAFQVDFDAPMLDWRRDYETREEFDADIQSNRLSCTYLMHLSPDEVSELLRLSYAVDGDPAGYENARNCCTGLLHCVTNIQTTIGKRVFAALTDGGALTNFPGSITISE